MVVVAVGDAVAAVVAVVVGAVVGVVVVVAVVVGVAVAVAVAVGVVMRVESGVIQFGDDWPGVFIRGDDAYGYLISLRRILSMAEAIVSHDGSARISIHVLKGLSEIFEASDVRNQGIKGIVEVQKLRSAEDCKAE